MAGVPFFNPVARGLRSVAAKTRSSLSTASLFAAGMGCPGVHRQLDRVVAHLLLHGDRRLPAPEQNAGIGMAEVMQANPAKARLGQTAVEDPLPEVTRVQRPAHLVRECPRL